MGPYVIDDLYLYIHIQGQQKAHAHVKWAQSMGVAIIAHRSTLLVTLVHCRPVPLDSKHAEAIFFAKFNSFIAFIYNLLSCLDLQIW